jgi:hypothetical protein
VDRQPRLRGRLITVTNRHELTRDERLTAAALREFAHSALHGVGRGVPTSG